VDAIVLAAVLSPVGWAIVSTLLMIGGVMLIAYTGKIPIINTITSIIGWSLIMMGGFFGVYGLFGEETALQFYSIAFLLVWIIGIIIIILFQVGILGRREEAYGGAGGGD